MIHKLSATRRNFKAFTYGASVMAMVVSGGAFAQDQAASDEQAEQETIDITEDGKVTKTEEKQQELVVTGSRLKKTTYDSISPLQVITTEQSESVGAFDPAQILHRTEAAAGQRIDATFQGFVLDNGPGSQTINLRGLGADRALLLLNGRRMAPAGVEGAPTNPSLNLIPGSLIDRYDLLLDGASATYGSDAMAGAVNIITKKDFDGLSLYASGDLNPMGGGDDYTVNGAWGFNTDRAFFGIGVEYDYQDMVRLRDRDFLSGCDTHYEITSTGEIRTMDLSENALVQRVNPAISTSTGACKITGISGRIYNGYTRMGSIYYQGAKGNTPVPGYSESTDAFGRPVDRNGDGIRDVDFQDVNTNATNLDRSLISAQKLINVMSYGEYAFDGEANITTFFEANYSRAKIWTDNSGAPQLFPYVPALNKFNPCNIDSNPAGVDCRKADNQFQGLTGTRFALSTGFSTPVIPIVSVKGDRNNFNVTQEQYRGVFGVKGDLPFISPSWSFETSGTYSRSQGKSIRRGIREDKLALALGIDPTADFNGDGIVDNNGDGIADDYNQDVVVWGDPGDQWIGECNVAALANKSLAMGDLAQGCVPVNLFAPSLLGSAIGDFATQAERDYLFGNRVFNTRYEQTVLSAFATGDLFKLAGGDASAVVGVEWRKDKIDSRPDTIASNGLLFGYFVDDGATGSKTTKEVYGEIDLPLQGGKPWVRQLDLNISGRFTNDEYYGTNFTYSVKGGWRPIDPLQFKMSYGSSFRAPSLRENFLKGQTGFGSVYDPCAVPDAAFVVPTTGAAGTYDPTLDQRDKWVLDNCRREGRDPTKVGIDTAGLNTYDSASAEIKSGGSFDIRPETSRSITAGFAFKEEFGGALDFNFNFNYYDIKLKDSIVEPSAQYIVNDCYTRQEGGRSVYCDRITASNSGTDRFLIKKVASGFLNLNEESVRGMDFNASIGKDVSMFKKNVELDLNIRANHLLERSVLFVQDDGTRAYTDYTGRFGLPKWTGSAYFTARVDKWTLAWETKMIGKVAQAPDTVDKFSDVLDSQKTGFIGNTCLGNGSTNGNVKGDGVFCRDIGYAGNYFTHTASIGYRGDGWRATIGVRNLFDKAPPRVDSDEVLAIANTPIGGGYDLDGREFFMNIAKEF